LRPRCLAVHRQQHYPQQEWDDVFYIFHC
jgi:hypothetical protein